MTVPRCSGVVTKLWALMTLNGHLEDHKNQNMTVKPSVIGLLGMNNNRQGLMVQRDLRKEGKIYCMKSFYLGSG